MSLIWRCNCGEEFPETGDWKGASKAGNHARHAGHKIVGLVDAETGELIVKGWSIVNAQRKGIGQRKAEEPPAPIEEPVDLGEPKTKKKGTGAAYGSIKPLVVELSPELLILYKLAQARFPDRYADATLGEFVSDCIGGYFADHAKAFKLNRFLGELRPELAASRGDD